MLRKDKIEFQKIQNTQTVLPDAGRLTQLSNEHVRAYQLVQSIRLNM